MNYRTKFEITPGSPVALKDFDPRLSDREDSKRSALARIQAYRKRMSDLQYQLYAESKQSLLICLQAPDAGGKDGVVKHVVSSMNPEGCHVASFKQPTPQEQAHDFLWRVEQQTPKRGEVVVFNRSHYEDVLVVRVHGLVPEEIWSKRYEQINDFERRLRDNHTHILKFFLHISKEEQLLRFKKRLDDPARQWKISDSDYSEREHWAAYDKAYEDMLSKCSTKHAPWFVIPSDHKWFRDLAVSQIIVEKMEDLGIKIPKTTVDLSSIRKKYHAAVGRIKP